MPGPVPALNAAVGATKTPSSTAAAVTDNRARRTSPKFSLARREVSDTPPRPLWDIRNPPPDLTLAHPRNKGAGTFTRGHQNRQPILRRVYGTHPALTRPPSHEYHESGMKAA
jgi:hypothetical protein